MKSFQEILTALRGQVSDLTSPENVEKMAAIAKTCDELEAAHKTAEEELQSTKNTLVHYVKDTSFKSKSEDDTGIEKTPSLDEAIASAFEDAK